MSVTPNYVPREYKTVNVFLFVKNAHEALKFYNSAFGAEVTMKLEDPNGVVVHSEMRIEDTVIMLSEADPDLHLIPDVNTGVVIQIFTGDVEGMFEDAINAGAIEILPIKKQFYGDRAGMLKDPFGHQWIISTHMEDVSPKELQKRFNDLYS